MLDTHVAWLANQGMNYLATGENPPRLGNQHPNIVPYQVFPTAGRPHRAVDRQRPDLQRFCEKFGLAHLPADPRFATNAARVGTASSLPTRCAGHAAARPPLVGRAAGGAEDRLRPDQPLSDVFADPHVVARNMVVEMPHGSRRDGEGDRQPGAPVGNPGRLPPAPAALGEHTDQVLTERLGFDDRDAGRSPRAGRSSDDAAVAGRFAIRWRVPSTAWPMSSGAIPPRRR